MPLIIFSYIYRSELPIKKKGISAMYVDVDKKYLSEQYDLTDLSKEYWVYGRIIDVIKDSPISEDEKKLLEQYVINREVKLFLVPGLFSSFYDKLYFDNDTWGILRDIGIIRGEYKLKIKLYKVEIIGSNGIKEGEINLYPYRDIIAEK